MNEDRLEQLRREAALLEPDAGQRKELLATMFRYVNRYLNELSALPTFVAGGRVSLDPSFPEAGEDLTRLLQEFEEQVNRPGLKPGGAGYLAFIPGGGLFAAALGDFLAAITNKYAGVYFAAPGAVHMEHNVVLWLARTVGYPADARGDLTSGGSLAHLSAIVTAREAVAIRSHQVPNAVVYLSSQTHHSVLKALRIAGLGDCVVRRIPLDERFRMRPDRLKETIEADRQQGLRPFLVVASAGTTDSGAVDPLPEIAEICDKHELWLHLDAAYGGAFALCDEGKKILAGMERSHSLILDPHKGLFLPFGTGAVLVRQGDLLRKAHEYEATYLIDRETLTQESLPSPADLSAELSRHFRGVRLWLPLKLHGVAPFRAALEEKLLLARYFYRKLQELPGFEPGPSPDLSIVTFRYRPRQGDVDTFNRKLIAAVQHDGRIFLSSTIIDSRFTLRLAVLGFRTHKEQIDLALHLLQQKARELEETGS